MMRTIEREVAAGERVILDLHGLTSDDRAALRAALEERGAPLTDLVLFHE